MRIGIVSETWLPEINGVALTVYGLATGLVARGHTVEVVRPRQACPSAADAHFETVFARGAALPRYPGLRFGLPAGRTLRERWSLERPDAIYIATEGPLGSSALRVANALRIPVASGFHTRFDSYASHYGLRWLTPLVRGHLRRFHRRAAATLVPTEALAQELASLGVDNARLLRRAVDTQLFHPGQRDPSLRAQWSVDAGTPVMLYVGRIAAEKNLELAVRAFRTAQQQLPAMRFVWVGDGPARAALQAANPDFVFAGTQRGEALARHIASTDLFPFPSLSETFGNVILEALACGVPVIAYREGAAREHLCDGYNGYCITPADADAFVTATATLAGNPGLIRHMGRRAHESMARLSPDQVIREFESLLRELAEEQRHEHHAVIVHA
ncbi:glycosyltransferase family 1 protein [Rhodanobacter sp. 7MK24]|uniref:glycosyltransferase family 4 protein n=1 Tax=Rhodanobacter sp. 7MK24 TaxID=2775922 RepID=UPI00177D1DD5|nr:glycosyltransferase family 1 protein [Rhodanobacter sp. 7MK24]MBD8881007.1 glycosyltransferase family 1 protein [Rhodanobacter sp. 7MK24]